MSAVSGETGAPDPDADPVTPESIEAQYKRLVFSSDALDYQIVNDIRNERGALLVPAGRSVDKASYERILQHKLMEPIDQCLRFADQITNEALVENITDLCEAALADTVYDFDDTLATVRELVAAVELDNVILNKLTVFRSSRPENFNHSLSTAFLSVELGRALKLSRRDLEDLFSVALFHDLGELFGDPGLDVRGELSEAEFEAVKLHPVVGHVVLKQSATRFRKAVLDGVLNHHERIDGSGYPRGISGAQVGLFERIVGAADAFDAMRRKGRSVDDAVWALRVQSGERSAAGDNIQPAYDPTVARILAAVVRDQGGNIQLKDPEYLDALLGHVDRLYGGLESVGADIARMWDHVDSYLEALDGDPADGVSRAVAEARAELYKLHRLILAGSGLLGQEIEPLADSPEDLNNTRKDIERVAPELIAHLTKVARALEHVASADVAGPLAEVLALNRSARSGAQALWRLVQQPFN
jgi:HD-GYP domain-containing protein (c-di-GMP phosphodiesterase class II)